MSTTATLASFSARAVGRGRVERPSGRGMSVRGGGFLVSRGVPCSSREPINRAFLPRSAERKSRRASRACRAPSAISDDAFYTGTVLTNNSASLDGAYRTLVVSVAEDPDGTGYRTKFETGNTPIRESSRLGDTYKSPGQYVIVKDDAGNQATLPIAASPYHVRSASAELAASVIELLVTREGDAECKTSPFAKMQPGATLEVGAVKGRGFEALIDKDVNLHSTMEKGHALVLIAKGTKGIAALHSLLDWQPVQAYADNHPVTLFQIESGNQAGAAYLGVDWDDWRTAGIKVVPCYGGFEDALLRIQQAVMTGEVGNGKFETVMGDSPDRCSLLLSGCAGEERVKAMNLFTAKGMSKSEILLADM